MKTLTTRDQVTLLQAIGLPLNSRTEFETPLHERAEMIFTSNGIQFSGCTPSDAERTIYAVRWLLTAFARVHLHNRISFTSTPNVAEQELVADVADLLANRIFTAGDIDVLIPRVHGALRSFWALWPSTQDTAA